MKNRKIDLPLLILIIYTFVTINSACKKFIEVDAPITSINKENVYNDNDNAKSVLIGIYTRMASSTFSLDLSLYPELSADNLTLFDENNLAAKAYYQNSLDSRYTNASSISWNDLYTYIYNCNDAIEGISKSTALNTAIKNRLLGEAYFLRAFYYFYLVNMYENVPLVLTTDYSIASQLPNSSPSIIYNQIINDLKQAENLLDNTYVDATLINASTDRVRPNRMAVNALLARAYLYTNAYIKSEEEASKLISKEDLYVLSDIHSTFLKSSLETIWALQPVSNNTNTVEGNFFLYPVEGPNSFNYTYLSKGLINSFEKGDLRSTTWVGNHILGNLIYPYPYKYKVRGGNPADATEQTIVLRLAEQYLIRAEARIQLGKISDGISDLNIVRKRARANATSQMPDPLPDLSPNLTKEAALEAVLKERRTELFTEWGNRWFDIKRTGKVNAIMQNATSIKGGIWKSFQSVYPIPQPELSGNPNLKQNQGYN